MANTNLLKSWRVNQKINHFLLTGLSDRQLNVSLSANQKNIISHFVHIHHTRLMWLELIAPELATGLKKFNKTEAPITQNVIDQLILSGNAINELIERNHTDEFIRAFKGSLTLFITYLISHESHHRGQLILTLKLLGLAPDRKMLYQIWNWPGFLEEKEDD